MYNIDVKTLLQQSISEPVFYDDSVYKFKRIVEKPNVNFKKITKCYRKSWKIHGYHATFCMPGCEPIHALKF